MDQTPEEKRDERRRVKALREQETADNYVVQSIMATEGGRNWVYRRLSLCGIFHTTFRADPYATAFNEGMRNIGLQLFAEVQRACPEAYILMLQEQSNDRRTESPIDRYNRDDERNWDAAGRWIGAEDAEPE